MFATEKYSVQTVTSIPLRNRKINSKFQHCFDFNPKVQPLSHSVQERRGRGAKTGNK